MLSKLSLACLGSTNIRNSSPKMKAFRNYFFRKLDVRVRYKSSSRNKMLDFNVEQVVLSLLRKPQYTK